MKSGPSPPPKAVREAIAEIARYAVAHPAAKDALEGVHRWWLPGGGARWQVDEVEAALEWLVDQGWIEVRRLGGRRIHAVQADRCSEMETWMGNPDGRRG